MSGDIDYDDDICFSPTSNLISFVLFFPILIDEEQTFSHEISK